MSDKSAFTDWVRQHTVSLHSWALHKTNDQETASDLVQETFAAAYQSLDKFKCNSSPKTWLISILNNKIIDHFRRKYRQPMLDQLKEDGIYLEAFFDDTQRWGSGKVPQSWDENVELLDDVQFRAILQLCLQRLPAVWQTAVHLKFLDERNGKEICALLDISPDNFWQIMHRAKLQLRECLTKEWFEQ